MAGQRAAFPPLASEQEARDLPAVREVWAALAADPGPGKMIPHTLAMLLDACAGAGVVVGAYDVRIMEWLAGWEPTTVAVIAGLISRAGQASPGG